MQQQNGDPSYIYIVLLLLNCNSKVCLKSCILTFLVTQSCERKVHAYSESSEAWIASTSLAVKPNRFCAHFIGSSKAMDMNVSRTYSIRSLNSTCGIITQTSGRAKCRQFQSNTMLKLLATALRIMAVTAQ